MKKTDNLSSLKLDKPAVAMPRGSAAFAVFFYALLLFLADAGAMGCLFTAFKISLNPLPIIIIAAVCSLVCSAEQLLKRRRWLVTVAILLAWGIALRLCFVSVERGCLRMLNAVFGEYSSKFNILLPQFDVSYTNPMRAARQNTIFAALLQVPFLKIMQLALISRKSSFAALLLSGLFVSVPLVISIIPAVWAIGALLTFWLFLLFTSSAMRRISTKHGSFNTAVALIARPSSFGLLLILALCVFGLYCAYPTETYMRPKSAETLKSWLTDGGFASAVNGGVGSGVNSVDLNALTPRNYTGKIAVRVKRTDLTVNGENNNETEYLKSFVGSVYTGTKWEKLSRTDSVAAEKALGGFAAQTMPSAMVKEYRCDSDGIGEYKLEIEKVSADFRSVYTPYGLDAMPERIKSVDDGYARADSLLGTENYEVTATAVPYYGIPLAYRFAQALTGGGQSAGKNFTFGEYGIFNVKSTENTELFDRLNSEFAACSAEKESVALAMEQWKIPNWAKASDVNFNRDLLEAAENYTDFVYKQYTQLPQKTQEFLDDFVVKYGLRDSIQTAVNGSEFEGDSVYTSAIAAIRKYFSDHCKYTLSPEIAPSDRDFTEYFLIESREGYCVHFATAATAILRYFGIPARYAEGYAVRFENSGEWVDVPDYCAHAWVEIYYSGTGWLPVEVTPAAAAVNSVDEQPAVEPTPSVAPTLPPAATDSTPSPKPISTATAMPEPTPAENETITISIGAPPPEKPQTVNPTMLLLLMISAVVIFAVWAQRKLRLACQKKALQAADNNRAVLMLYKSLLKLRAELSKCDSTETKMPEELENLALKARFSNVELTDSELLSVEVEKLRLTRKLEKFLSLTGKIKCKYILALF